MTYSLLIVFPYRDQLSGNHESLKNKIPKRKKARPNTPLSCNTQHYIKTTSAYFSGRSAFFTDDQAILNRVVRPDLTAAPHRGRSEKW
jgi:hypothetical protein